MLYVTLGIYLSQFKPNEVIHVNKNLLIGLAVGLVIGIIVGATASAVLPFLHKHKEESLLEKIKKRGVLIVGTSADWPPFEYIDKSGNYAGIDIEIAKKIAEAIGVKLEIKDIKFDALIAALKGGEIDMIIADMTPTAEREKEVDFSKPYYSDVFVFVVLKSSNISSLEDLYGKTIGVQQGTIQEEWANEHLKGKCTIKSYTKVYPDMVLVLERGDVDAILISKTVAEVLMAKDPELKIAFLVKGTEEYAAIAVPENAEDLKYVVNKVIEQLKSSGELDKIIQQEIVKWLKEQGG